MTSLDGIEIFPAVQVSMLAHQGGWDEILLVAAPLLVVGLLLWLANRRVSAQLEQAQDQPGQSSPPQDHTQR